MSLLWAVAVGLSASMTWTAQAGPVPVEVIHPDRDGIVLARVVATEATSWGGKEGGIPRITITATLRIEHVLWGPGLQPEGLWKAVQYQWCKSGCLVLDPPLQVDEVGLWLVEKSADGTLHPATLAMIGSGYHVILPTRSPPGAIDPIPQREREWSEAVAETLRAAPEERLGLLAGLAVSRAPAVSAWAITMLGRVTDGSGHGQDQDAIALLRQFPSNAGIPLEGQVALDEALLTTKGVGSGWVRSEERVRLFERWVSAPIDTPGTGARAMFQIGNACLRGQISTDTAASLLTKAMANDRVSAEARESFEEGIVRGVVMDLFKRGEHTDEAFNAAMKIMLVGATDNSKAQAAGMLLWVASDASKANAAGILLKAKLTPEQAAAVEIAAAGSTSDHVRMTLKMHKEQLERERQESPQQ